MNWFELILCLTLDVAKLLHLGNAGYLSLLKNKSRALQTKDLDFLEEWVT